DHHLQLQLHKRIVRGRPERPRPEPHTTLRALFRYPMLDCRPRVRDLRELPFYLSPVSRGGIPEVANNELLLRRHADDAIVESERRRVVVFVVDVLRVICTDPHGVVGILPPRGHFATSATCSSRLATLTGTRTNRVLASLPHIFSST